MTTPTFHGFTGLFVEHMLGQLNGPLVKITAESDDGHYLLGQVSPDEARQMATHLMGAAARAEYEADLMTTMTANGWEDEVKAALLHMVRHGEAMRHEAGDGDS